LQRAGVGIEQLSEVILTHFHPDHTYGFPMLLMGMWLLGRQSSLEVYGVAHCLERAEAQMIAYHWAEWPDFFPVTFRQVPESEDAPVLENEDFHITAWPVRHFVPTIGLRVEVKTSGKVLAYSSDTEPVPELVRLVHEADVLVHEASGETAGHSSSAQAGALAAEAGVGKLVLVHYEMPDSGGDPLVAEAVTTFDGPVELADDYAVVEL
jgi:ribonuclease Z